MLHRAASLLIIVFWLTMTWLLVRNEIAPDGSSMREVPVSHALRLLFLPERGSGLNITTDGALIGHLALTPHVDRGTDLHELEFDSAMQVRLGVNVRQRIKLVAHLYFDGKMTLHKSTFALLLFDPSPLKTEVEIEPGANRAHVLLSSQPQLGAPWQPVEERNYTLDQAGARDLLEQMGIDPALLTTMSTTQAAPTIRARQSSLALHGDRVDTYLLTIEQSGQTLMEIHISQLGNVLQAKTLLGYDFAPDEVTP